MSTDAKFIDSYYKGTSSVSDLNKFILKDAGNSSVQCEHLGLTPEEFEMFKNSKTENLEQSLKARKISYIIEKAKAFFRNEIASNHLKNVKKLAKLSKFQLNPFLDKYKANFLTGNSSPESIARALLYPRVLGTSINTTFGSSMQKFCSNVLDGFASTTSGMDIEFIDAVDGRKKYCQIKAGPNTINKDDVITIKNHFQRVKNLGRTNNLDIRLTDMVVGVFYGSPADLSTHYKKINLEYPVYVGQEFWHRLTGEEQFYQELSDALASVANEYDLKDKLEEIICKLADDIKAHYH